MFRRKAYEKLLSWKEGSRGSRALLLEGARRTGKSTLARAFAENEYAGHLVIDFSEASEDIKDLFRMYRSDVDSFFMYLQAYTGAPPAPPRLPRRLRRGAALPPAREFIKQLVADGRYDYLETGSLISIRRNVEGIVIPSEETPPQAEPARLRGVPLGCGEEALANLIRSSAEDLSPLPAPLHRKAERLFREYMLVGGMPQAVSEYLEARDFGRVDAVKRDILSLYRNDIAKFGGADATRIARVFSTLPGQLAKHDRKFRLVSLDANARGRDYADAFFWLSDAFITSTCLNATDPSVGLAATADESSFKCYMGDTGLLVSHLFADNGETPHEVYRDILLGKLEINEGMFTENAVAQQLVCSGRGLYFYSRRDDRDWSNTMEVDFLVTRGYDDAAGRMRVSPVEVKSTKRYGARSLDKFKDKFGSRVGTRYILHPRPMEVSGDLVRLPLYASMAL